MAWSGQGLVSNCCGGDANSPLIFAQTLASDYGGDSWDYSRYASLGRRFNHICVLILKYHQLRLDAQTSKTTTRRMMPVVATLRRRAKDGVEPRADALSGTTLGAPTRV